MAPISHLTSLRAAWLLALLFVSACGADEAPPALRQPTVPPTFPVPDHDDTSGGDDIEAPEDTRPDTDTTPGTLADNEPCNADLDCSSKYCGWRSDGRRCGPRCDSGVCPDGFVCVDAVDGKVCASPHVTQCSPCGADADCQAPLASVFADADLRARCVADGTPGGGFCAATCGPGSPSPELACPTGTACEGGVCRPLDHLCTCSVFAVENGAASPCINANDAGSCAGSSRCTTVGATRDTCDAPAAAAESCNAVDDDCDGQTDERPLNPTCAPYACGGEGACLTECQDDRDCAPGYGCETGSDGRGACLSDGSDGSVCTDADTCDSNYCANGFCCNPEAAGFEGEVLCCAEDLDCAALDGAGACVSADGTGCAGMREVGRCQAGICVAEMVPDAEACRGTPCGEAACGEGATYLPAPTCDAAGACTPPTAVVCGGADICLRPACDETVGCVVEPVDGPSGQACYPFDPATRGVGACTDGQTLCLDGVLTACDGAVGPAEERCNGLDDDCDTRTDEDTERACFPYLCGGSAGCFTRCDTDAQCAAGNYCGTNNRCVPTGEDGSACNNERQCVSGFCSQGVCCSGGTCCRSQSDCRGLDALACEDRELGGCLGFRATGRCDPDFVCRTDVVEAPEACLGQSCNDTSLCLADGGLGTGFACDAEGACLPGLTTDCAPYRCGAGACPTSCTRDDQCVDGSRCTNGVCARLPDGASCSFPYQCASNYCSQGVCCSGGLCCRNDTACASLDGTATCLDRTGCTGEKAVGRCSVDFRCRTERIAWPAACQGQSCGAPTCVNLSGGSFFLEGVRRPTCSATGTCEEVVRDCDGYVDNAFCDDSGRAIYGGCSNCSPARSTCVALGRNCSCE